VGRVRLSADTMRRPTRREKTEWERRSEWSKPKGWSP
jgi:hypothetical protein